MSVHIPVNYLIQVYAATPTNALTCSSGSQATIPLILTNDKTQEWVFVPIVDKSNTYYIHNGVTTDGPGSEVYLWADMATNQVMGGDHTNATAWTIVPLTISALGVIETFTLRMSNTSSTIGSDVHSPQNLVVGGGHTIIWDVLVQDELLDDISYVM